MHEIDGSEFGLIKTAMRAEEPYPEYGIEAGDVFAVLYSGGAFVFRMHSASEAESLFQQFDALELLAGGPADKPVFLQAVEVEDGATSLMPVDPAIDPVLRLSDQVRRELERRWPDLLDQPDR
jgi:hypothetical protein